ncbi:MAG: MerR family transcriptional regulator [Lachnospiraceae bacterium]|nr:MerR family transcriptional regulator [Lachnospiraceae bacterium]
MANNILVPSKLSEGGRRLYSDDDLTRMRIICFLREAGISISSIESLLHDEHPEKVIWVSKYYFKNVAYICPECHKVFKPRFKEAFWANHTPTLRKLTCTGCGHKGWCVETCAEEVKQND